MGYLDIYIYLGTGTEEVNKTNKGQAQNSTINFRGREKAGAQWPEFRPRKSTFEKSEAVRPRWLTPLIPALERRRQADLCLLQSKFKDSWGCSTEKPCLQRKFVCS